MGKHDQSMPPASAVNAMSGSLLSENLKLQGRLTLVNGQLHDARQALKDARDAIEHLAPCRCTLEAGKCASCRILERLDAHLEMGS